MIKANFNMLIMLMEAKRNAGIIPHYQRLSWNKQKTAGIKR